MQHSHRLPAILGALAVLAVPATTVLPAQAAAVHADEIDTVFARARPTDREARWRLIPWRATLTRALAEAEHVRKPVFVVLADGWFPSGTC